MGAESSLATPVPYATGKTHAIPLVPVKFRIYQDLDCRDSDVRAQNQAGVSRKSWSSLFPTPFKNALNEWAASREIENYGWGKPVLASNKWIYVYRAPSGGSLSLDSEFQVSASGDKQSFKLVSWKVSDRDKWSKQYPRPATVTNAYFQLKAADEHFVLISDFQLPFQRIVFYQSAKGRDALVRRSLHVPKGALVQVDGNPALIDLVDARAVANAAKERANKARAALLKFATDEKNAAKRYIGGFLLQVSKKESDVKKWVPLDKVQGFMGDQEKSLRELSGDAESAEAFLYGWMRLGPFVESREDAFAATKAELEAIETQWLKDEVGWVGSALACQYGLQYLEDAAADNTWFARMFLGIDGFLVKKTLIGLDESGLAELLNRYLVGRILWRLKGLGLGYQVTEYAKLQTIHVEIIREVEIIVKRLSLNVVRFGRFNGLLLTSSTYAYKKTVRLEYKIDEYQAVLKNLPSKGWQNSVEGLGKVASSLVLAIEIGNLFGSLKGLSESKDLADAAWNSADALSSAADTIGAVEFLVQRSAITVSKVVFDRISVVGAILDYALYTRKAALSMEKGKYGLAAAYAVTALSAVMMGAGGALGLMGEGALAFGFAAGPWMVVGALVLLVGSALIYYFTESDLEEWAIDSHWGSRGAPKGDSLSELRKQIFNLHELLSKFESKCFVTSVPIRGSEAWNSQGNIVYDYNHYLVLKIDANLFIEGKSVFKTKLVATDVGMIGSGDNIAINPKDTSMSLPDKDTLVVKSQDGQRRSFIRKWKLNDPNAMYRAQNGKYEYDLEIKLDFQGDGSLLFPSDKGNPHKHDGDCEFIPVAKAGIGA